MHRIFILWLLVVVDRGCKEPVCVVVLVADVMVMRQSAVAVGCKFESFMFFPCGQVSNSIVQLWFLCSSVLDLFR